MEYFTDELNDNPLKSEHVENFKATQAFLSHNEFICPIENGQPIIVKDKTNNRFLTSNKSFEYKSYSLVPDLCIDKSYETLWFFSKNDMHSFLFILLASLIKLVNFLSNSIMSSFISI